MIMIADRRILGEWADGLSARDRERIYQIHQQGLGGLATRSISEYSLGERISTLRRMSGLSQEELAAFSGVSRQTVSNWETGDAQPRLPNATRLAEVFGVPLDFFR